MISPRTYTNHCNRIFLILLNPLFPRHQAYDLGDRQNGFKFLKGLVKRRGRCCLNGLNMLHAAARRVRPIRKAYSVDEGPESVGLDGPDSPSISMLWLSSRLDRSQELTFAKSLTNLNSLFKVFKLCRVSGASTYSRIKRNSSLTARRVFSMASSCKPEGSRVGGLSRSSSVSGVSETLAG